jgi:GT2 family glycosyltransferase
MLAVFDDHPEAGLVGAKLIYPDGRSAGSGRHRLARRLGVEPRPQRRSDKPEFNYLREADYCSGACLAIPAALFRDLGGFDTRYAPAYYEDTDLAFAVRAARRKVFYQPKAGVVHLEGQTQGTDESRASSATSRSITARSPTSGPARSRPSAERRRSPSSSAIAGRSIARW